MLGRATLRNQAMKASYAVQLILDHYGYLKPQEVVRRLRYSSFVSLPKRYMYFEVPKAACTAMKWLLHGLEAGPPVQWALGKTRREMFIHWRENVPLPSLVDLDNAAQKHVLESAEFLRITVVRNPYTRLISTWRNKILLYEPGSERVYLDIKGRLPEPGSMPLISFAEFVEYLANKGDLRSGNSHWRRQTDHTFFSAMNFSHVGKFERLGETLRHLQLHLGLSEPPALGARNQSPPVGHVAFDGGLAEMISRLYRTDFETFGYDTKAWPAQEQGGPGQSKNAIVEAVYRDEVIERNIIISVLSKECERLQRLLNNRGQVGAGSAGSRV
jgi:hypothetical protein